MNTTKRTLLVGTAVALATAAAPTAAVLPAHAACAALGRYTLLPKGAGYAASASFGAATLPILAGSATMRGYSGCGSATLLQISSDGPGAVLRKPVALGEANVLRVSGDLLLHLTATVRHDPQTPATLPSVLATGVATYVRVTSKGKLHGKQVRLSYSTTTVKFTNARGQLHVTSALGGALSLAITLPGPSLGGIASNFAYFAVGAKSPAKFKGLKKPLSGL